MVLPRLWSRGGRRRILHGGLKHRGHIFHGVSGGVAADVLAVFVDHDRGGDIVAAVDGRRITQLAVEELLQYLVGRFVVLLEHRATDHEIEDIRTDFQFGPLLLNERILGTIGN